MEPEKHAYTVKETAKALGIGRNKTLELIHSGKLRHIRVGTRIVVPKKAVDAFLEVDQA
jgi:excisionase family DNA binding protein